jgi:hypothetical protein
MTEITADHWQGQEATGAGAGFSWAHLRAEGTWFMSCLGRSPSLQFTVGACLGFVVGAVLLFLALLAQALPLLP